MKTYHTKAKCKIPQPQYSAQHGAKNINRSKLRVNNMTAIEDIYLCSKTKVIVQD